MEEDEAPEDGATRGEEEPKAEPEKPPAAPNAAPAPTPIRTQRPQLTEEELLERAREERRAIVERYDRGREEGAQIDPWEDPAFEIYHTTDRYGFIHDKRLPRKDLGRTAKQKEVEMERVKKWLKMLSAWEKYRGGDKLRRRVFKGIPDKLRGAVWARLLGLQRLVEEQAGKYAEMRDLAREWSSELRQIDLDVNRTYRDHVMFRERYGLKQQALFHVLGAYSVYDAEIGYCQGMSQVAALLLMYLDEEQAFWALSALMSHPNYAMHGFFVPGFPKLLRFQRHHDRVLTRLLPRLKKHLDRCGVDTALYTLKWFFQCFLDRVPFQLTLRLWDVYLLEGERIPVAMAYTLVKLHRKTMLRLGMDDILHFLQVRLERDFGFEDDAVMEALDKSLEELRRLRLDHPGPAPTSELPQRPFGLFVPPSPRQQTGLRRPEMTAEEITANQVVMRRRMDNAEAAAAHDTSEAGDSSHMANHSWNGARASRTSVSSSHCSLDAASLDDESGSWPSSNFRGIRSGTGTSGSGTGKGGSRVSLAATSATSAADVSVLSRSQACDEDEDIETDGAVTPVPPPSPSPNPLRIFVPGPTPQSPSPRLLSPSPTPPQRRNGTLPRRTPSPAVTDTHRITLRVSDCSLGDRSGSGSHRSSTPFQLDSPDELDLK